MCTVFVKFYQPPKIELFFIYKWKGIDLFTIVALLNNGTNGIILFCCFYGDKNIMQKKIWFDIWYTVYTVVYVNVVLPNITEWNGPYDEMEKNNISRAYRGSDKISGAARVKSIWNVILDTWRLLGRYGVEYEITTAVPRYFQLSHCHKMCREISWSE